MSDDAMKMWNMRLNETIIVGGWSITRVPGGWIYLSNEPGGSAVFVPLNREFVKVPHG